jgi:DNA polymerase III delta prime subunit
MSGLSQYFLYMKTLNLSYPCRLDVDEGGLTALVRLSNGDMRKALNILQVTSE